MPAKRHPPSKRPRRGGQRIRVRDASGREVEVYVGPARWPGGSWEPTGPVEVHGGEGLTVEVVDEE